MRFNATPAPPISYVGSVDSPRPLNVEVLRRAVHAYDFPAVTFDFDREIERQHVSMRSVEQEIKRQLTADDLGTLRDGLSNVLYWGHARAGYRDHRVLKFRAAVQYQHLESARALFRRIEGAELVAIKKIGLPQFSQMSFISKIRMFLEPSCFVTLDLKLARLRDKGDAIPLHALKVNPTSIPVTAHNERIYTRWCETCQRIAHEHLRGDGARAVDVERAVFHLVGSGHASLAAQLLVMHGS